MADIGEPVPEGPSLHAAALAAARVDGPAMTDRELAIVLLRRSTESPTNRWERRAAQVPLPQGSGVREALLRVAGINPDEMTGWEDCGDTCPLCGRQWDDGATWDEVSHV
jgi:hypothetical protein